MTGTGLNLNYRSDRVPGRLTARTVEIPLTGASVPRGLMGIELELTIAGQRVRRLFDPLANQRTTFTWDGQDAYGRPLQGQQTLFIRIGYVYPAVYLEPGDLAATFGYNGGGLITGSQGRQAVTIWRDLRVPLGAWDARGQGLGGWTLDVHHAYDPLGRVLYLGTGDRRTTQHVERVIDTAAVLANGMSGVAVGADGSVYIATPSAHRVWRLAPDGQLTAVAGTGVAGFSGDGGPAVAAMLNAPHGVAVGPDGSLYLADTHNHRIRRIDRDGIIRTVVGTGVEAYGGDGGPATQAQIGRVPSLAVAADGTLYLADLFNHRVRRVGPDGVITTLAGTGLAGYTGDGIPAAQTRLWHPEGVGVGPDGSVYIADASNRRIRRVGIDGLITTVAGGGIQTADGVPATLARITYPHSVVVLPDQSLIFVDSSEHLVRRVDARGIITTVAGTRSAGFGGDGGPATDATLNTPTDLAAAPDGSLYIADTSNRRVRRIGPPLPGFDGDELAVASADGEALYVFDAQGRHLRTLDVRTRAVQYSFGYDAAGRLQTITDVAGRVTQIERDAAGPPAAIVAPGGQRTTLSVDAQGYLASVTNPAGETVGLVHDAQGLLRTLTTPRQDTAHFAYDDLGRLVEDEDAAGGVATLARGEADTSYTVTVTTAPAPGESRTTRYHVERLPTGAERWETTEPSGVKTTEVRGPGSSRTLTAPDGTVTTLVPGPDPRFGMQAPVAQSLTTRLPSGLTRTVTAARSVTLADPFDPLSATTQIDTVTLNGRTYTATYDAVTRTLLTRTPAGRETVTTLDALGRVVQVDRPGLAPVSLAYDARGRLEMVTEGTGPTARVTTFGYDGLDRLISLRDPAGRMTGFAYDLADRVTAQTRPDSAVIGLGYDANGNVTAVVPPGRPAHAFTYTPVDLEASYTPPAVPDVADPATTYTYNLDKQPTLVTRPDGQTLTFGYDSGGRLRTITQPRGTTTLAYEPGTGRLAGVTAPDGGTLAYTYDGSLLTSVTWGSGPVTGSVAWTYDADFRVATEAVNGAQSVTYTYDPDSLVTGVGALTLARDPQTGFLTGATLGAVTDSRTYTPFGEPETYRADANGAPVLEVAYLRDALGRIVEQTETLEGVTTVTGYRYDAAGRLDQVTVDGVVTATYTYDANGNRLSATTPSGTETGTYDEQDRLLTYGGATYTYTANGELRTKTDASGTTTYTYDLLGNLTRVDLPDGRVLEYLIDGQNRRIGKTVDGMLVQGWLYRDQLKPVAELDGSGQVVARFVYGSNPLVPDYVVKGGATYRLLTDHLGSLRLVVDTATGAVVQRRDYDAWGNVLLDTNPGFQPFGFAGGLEDPDTGLVRFGVRDYDPRIGRWTAKDAIRFAANDTNLYRYALADPTNLRDPLGLWTVGIGLSGIIGAGAGYTESKVFVFDSRGNYGTVYSRGAGGYGGIGTSLGLTFQWTSADTICELSGMSVQIGSSVSPGLISVGGELVIQDAARPYGGFDINVGFGPNLTPVETHGVVLQAEVNGWGNLWNDLASLKQVAY
ncbi:MAG TPA: RHS repeat-associated core domain-containing protein [Thermodesulfobacteriota bacterium]